jgi:hypothetical protein
VAACTAACTGGPALCLPLTRPVQNVAVLICAVSARLSCNAFLLLLCLCCAAALGGPLPASITQLRNLEVLSVESNELSGTVPPNLCTDMTALRVRTQSYDPLGSMARQLLCNADPVQSADSIYPRLRSQPCMLCHRCQLRAGSMQCWFWSHRR